MRYQSKTLQMSARNTLAVRNVSPCHEKEVIGTMKASNDLRRELENLKPYKGPIRVSRTNRDKQNRAEQDIMIQQVAALDHFKAPVSRDSTKMLIMKIKVRRREKHIDSYNYFKETLNDYKDNVISLYQSFQADLQYVLKIKHTQTISHLDLMNDAYLLSKEKEILVEIQVEVGENKNQVDAVIKKAREDIEKLKLMRGNVAQRTCAQLRNELIEIAFVLQPEAREIEQTEKVLIEQIEKQQYEKCSKMLDDIESQQQKRKKDVVLKAQQKIEQWKNVKQKFEETKFTTLMDSEQYRNPKQRQQFYRNLVQLQEENHRKKMELIANITKEDPDVITKANIAIWSQCLKTVNEKFEAKIDKLFQKWQKQVEVSKRENQKMFQHLKSRLIYIEAHSQEEIINTLSEIYQPILDRNLQQAQKLVKEASQKVQAIGQKENSILSHFSTLMEAIGTNNDHFSNQFTSGSKNHELQKMHILDSGDEQANQLHEELECLKEKVTQALHHIKLNEVRQQCFEKIDSIEVVYRKTYEQIKECVAARSLIVAEFIPNYEAAIASTFSLCTEAKRQELEEKNLKQAEAMALKMVEEEAKELAKKEVQAAEQAKKNGAKVPPVAKPKDAKKLAAELEEKKKIKMAEIGVKPIKTLISATGVQWLIQTDIESICAAFFLENNKEETLGKVITDCNGTVVVSQNCLPQIGELVKHLTIFRAKLFASLADKKQRIQQENQQQDSQFVQECLQNLGTQLKEHYDLKGKLQSGQYVRRCGEITNHKKRYEKYARSVKEKMDLQTDKFNLQLEESMQTIKSFQQNQKEWKAQLASAKNSSELQGLLTKSRNSFQEFTSVMKSMQESLQKFSEGEVQAIINHNQQFLKESKLRQDGGQYSQEEIQWYRQMLAEIDSQIKEQATKRAQKAQELKSYADQIGQSLYSAFQKEHTQYVEEMSVKCGMGAKFGKPKRIVREQIRWEMNKCEQAQISISKQLDQLQQICEETSKRKFEIQSPSFLMELRQRMMTIQSCIVKYGDHIQAIVPDTKAKRMVRVGYNSSVPSCQLSPSEAQEDKKRMTEQLSQLGPLSEQKDAKTYKDLVGAIEKTLVQQVQALYTGDKAKYLTGADKIPDYLRIYLQQFHKNTYSFWKNSVNQLKTSCKRLSNLSTQLSQSFFSSLKQYFTSQQSQYCSKYSKSLNDLLKRHQAFKVEQLQHLRPNLTNPRCQEELQHVCEEGNAENVGVRTELQSQRTQFIEKHFQNASGFINCLLNHYEYLMLFADSLYLHEDFVSVEDEDEEKAHLSIKHLIIKKQKGIEGATNCQRVSKRKWEGLNYTLYDYETFNFKYEVIAEQPVSQKDKKPGKGAKVEIQQTTPCESVKIETYKTRREKVVFSLRNQVMEDFLKGHLTQRQKILSIISSAAKQNQHFKGKWEQMAASLTVQ